MKFNAAFVSHSRFEYVYGYIGSHSLPTQVSKFHPPASVSQITAVRGAYHSARLKCIF